MQRLTKYPEMITISDLCITSDPISLLIADKLMVHIDIINDIQRFIQAEIICSKKSGYRSYKYELSRGRSGTSQHCFRSKGAVDLSLAGGSDEFGKFVERLRKSGYNRVCYYPKNNFVHCDFKYPGKHFFICEDGANWIRSK